MFLEKQKFISTKIIFWRKNTYIWKKTKKFFEYLKLIPTSVIEASLSNMVWYGGFTAAAGGLQDGMEQMDTTDSVSDVMIDLCYKLYIKKSRNLVLFWKKMDQEFCLINFSKNQQKQKQEFFQQIKKKITTKKAVNYPNFAQTD